MRIVYVGNFKRSWCTEVHVSRDAERIPGVKVQRVQEPRASVTSPRAWKVWLRDLEQTASDADLLIYQRTWGLPAEAIDVWRNLEDRGCKTISYHLDLYVGIEREATIDGDPFWQTGVVFTADGDPHTAEVLEAKGIDHRWMPAACVSDEAHPVPPSPKGTWLDVVFVGSRPDGYHQEWRWRGQLLRGLAARYDARFACLPTPGEPRIHGRELNELYATVPVVVGDSLSLPGHRNYWSDRFYETIGRGGFLVGPNVPGIETQFTSGEHCDLYEIGDLEHVYELVDQALADREGARSIARAGSEHVYAHHTYRHRVEAILTSLDLLP